MVLAEADRVIMTDGVLELGEHVFISERDAERVDVDVAACDVEERRHFLHVVWNDEGMRLARRLEGIVACGCDPVVFEVAPLSSQRERVHGPGVTVARQHARTPDAQDVDVESLAYAQDQRLKGHGRGLRHPLPFVAVQIEGRADECVRHHAEGLRSLIGDLALVDGCALRHLSLLRRNGSAHLLLRKCDVRGRGRRAIDLAKGLVRRPHQCQFPSMHW